MQKSRWQSDESAEEDCLRACWEEHCRVIDGDAYAACLSDIETMDKIVDPEWALFLSDCRAMMSTRMRQVVYLQRQGVPHQYRAAVWQAITEANNAHLTTLYDRLDLSNDNDTKDLPYFNIIARDLDHSTPKIKLYNQLKRVLVAYAQYDATIGYRPSLIHIARHLVDFMPEREAFCTLVRLIQLRGLRSLFVPNSSALQAKLEHFHAILSQCLPQLEQYLTRHGITPQNYASEWYLSLFTCSVNAPRIYRVLDFVFFQGLDAITRVSIATLARQQDDILSIDCPKKILSYLRDLKIDHDDWLDDALSVCSFITPTTTKAQLNSPPLDHFTPPPMMTKAKLHQQIEGLVGSLSQLQKNHASLLEEVTEHRTRKAQHAQALKRQAQLEKRVKKYKTKLQRQDQTGPAAVEPSNFQRSNSRPASMETIPPKGYNESVPLDSCSRRASCLHGPKKGSVVTRREDSSSNELTQAITAIRLANYDLGKSYASQCQANMNLRELLDSLLHRQQELRDQCCDLDELVKEQDAENDLLRQAIHEGKQENEVLAETIQAENEAAKDLQESKVQLEQQMEQLQQDVQCLEEEKQVYRMTCSSFTDEVFAVHEALYGPCTKTPTAESMEANIYRTKFVESDTRCQELEKLLVEAKMKLAEPCSESDLFYFYRPHPPSPLQQKRLSNASLLMSKTNPRSSLARLSADSFASSTTSASSSASSSQRFSVVSRPWSTIFSSPSKPILDSSMKQQHPVTPMFISGTDM